MGAFDDIPNESERRARLRAEDATLKEAERHDKTKLALERAEDELKEVKGKLADALAQLRAERASVARGEEAIGAERTARLEALTGAAATFSPGAIKANSSVALTGAKGTFSAGAVKPAVSVTVTGKSVAFATGLVKAATTVPLTGRAATFSSGIVTPVVGVTVSLTGALATFHTGTLTASVTPGTVTKKRTGIADDFDLREFIARDDEELVSLAMVAVSLIEDERLL